MEGPLINRVAQSGLITINPEDFYPKTSFSHFDLKDYLFKELILRESEFRDALRHIDWSQYENTILLLYCSTDAIIPMWAYMLVSSYAGPFAEDVFHGSEEDYLKYHFKAAISELDISEYLDGRIVIKGCSNKKVPISAYLDLTTRLRPHVRSIMFGEPCSTVPIFKKPGQKVNK